MNERDTVHHRKLETACRACLKTNIPLYPISFNIKNLYQMLLEKTMTEDQEVNLCLVCRWVLKKLDNFRRQCRTANNILENLTADTKFPSHSHNCSIYDLKETKVEINYFVASDTLADTTIIKTEDVLEDCYQNGSELSMVHDEQNHILEDDDFNIDTDDNQPLVMLKSNGKRQKKKKKDRIPKSSLSMKSKKDKKELRNGFSSRMVQETDEYVVIKLTKEQVLEEMEKRLQSDAYLRSPYKCEKCVKGYNFADVLQSHMEKHTMENGSFQCDMCTQYCPSAVSLRGHIKSHTTRYKCKLCDHVRLSRQHLLEHHAITHKSQAVTYTCDTCQFTTNKRTVMQRHVKSHNSTRTHACHKCGKLFKTIDSLRVHTMRHDKSARVKCTLCDNKFVYHSVLHKHMISVHQRRDYYCVECDVEFKSAESLRLHFKKAKRHRDSSTYKHICPQCDSKFPSASSLTSHLCSTHAAPRQQQCSLCNKLYTTRDALRAHVWRTHRQTNNMD